MVTAAARGEVRPVVMQTTTGNMDSATSGIIRRPAGRRPDGGGHGFNRLYETPAGLSPSQRFEHWREWYSQAIENPVRLEPTGPLSARFFPSASSLTGPGFSLIELHNGPAVGSWNANPDLNDLRLTYFAKAPSATYNFGREPVSINAPRVRFLDLTRGGAFRAPAGMHIIQLNLDRTGLELNGAGAMRLAAAENLIQHPVLRSLLMPVLLNCRAAGMEAHVAASGTVLRSAVAALISSLLDVQASPELLEPSRRLAVKNYLQRNYASGDMSADAIAERFHVSRRALFMLFEEERLGLGARIRLLRTARALELLLDPAWKLQRADEIAAAAGFTNAQALRRALKQATGLGVRDLKQSASALEKHLTDLRDAIGA